jgi:hypothetical protein
LLFTGFQDQLHRPLGQTSVKEFIATKGGVFSSAC